MAGFGAPVGGDDEGEGGAGAQAVLALPSGDVGDASPMAASPLASSGCPAPNPSRSASSSSISSSLTEPLSTSSGSWPLAPADAPRTGCGLGGRCGASSADGDDDDEGELRSRHHSLRRCSPAVGSTSVPSASSGRRSQRRARPGAARAPSAREWDAPREILISRLPLNELRMWRVRAKGRGALQASERARAELASARGAKEREEA